MAYKAKIVVTREITAEEAEACAKEQVQFIGSIQPHGFVLVVDKKTLKIIQHSNNVLSLLNLHEPNLSLNTPIIDTELKQWIKFSTKELRSSNNTSSIKILNFKSGGIIDNNLWECFVCCNQEYISLEFLPCTKPQRATSILDSIDCILHNLWLKRGTQNIFQTITKEFQKFTQYDRVMLYKFLPDWSGEVIAESVSKNTEVLFKGLRFPEEDIPKAARELYANSILRIIADAEAEPVEFTPQLLPSGTKLNQSVSLLRSMSKMHVIYLKNLNVRASLSIALMAKDKLWGLLSFHNYAPKIPPQSHAC